MKKRHYSPDRICNVDETGIRTIGMKQEKVTALKGKKKIDILSSVKQGALITILTSMNTTGGYLPPLIVLSTSQNVPLSYLDGAPLNSQHAWQKSGWIQTDIFTRWFWYFIGIVKPTEEPPVILILDGHGTHTRNLGVTNLWKSCNTDISSTSY